MLPDAGPELLLLPLQAQPIENLGEGAACGHLQPADNCVQTFKGLKLAVHTSTTPAVAAAFITG
jgi:hypothetical protein